MQLAVGVRAGPGDVEVVRVGRLAVDAGGEYDEGHVGHRKKRAVGETDGLHQTARATTRL